MKIVPPYSYKAIIYAIIVAFILSSCHTASKLLKPGEYLLVRNNIHFSGKNPGIKADELSSIAKPKPNQKFLGLARIKLYKYYVGTKKNQDKKWRTKMREKTGERPAIFDSSAALQSSAEMKLYLNKVGYFYSNVTFKTKHYRNNKMEVNYLVTPSVPYKLKTVEYALDDTVMLKFIKKSKTETKILPGSVYNAFDLDDERDRITQILQNNGYYYFNRDFVYYEIDSAGRNHEMNLKVKIKPNIVASSEDPSVTLSLPHKRYFIRDLYIRPNFDPLAPANIHYDTVRFSRNYFDKKNIPGNYYIIYKKKDNIHPRTILQSVFIKPGDPFSLTDIKMTRLRVVELGAFGYANIRFKPIPLKDTAVSGKLDCFIDLSKRKLHAFTIETEVTNSGGKPGVGLNFTYSNSNIFRGSETLRLRARVALEAQQIWGNDTTITNGSPFINTIETSFEVSIIFPRFLIPIRQEKFPKYFRPKTTASLVVGYENRPDYMRWLTNLNFGYDWKETEKKRHQVIPFDWSLINITNSPEFQAQLDAEPNDLVKYQYTDNLIMAARYIFTYNTQDITKIKNFFFFRGSFETAGNLLHVGSTLFNANTDSLGHYVLFSIPFAQYAKIDCDFRFFNVITRNSSVAYRLFMGVGLPYGNASALPLERGFYGGGSNGMRGWPYRLLGPGSYHNPEDKFDRMGDVQLEGNIEFRFPVYKFLKSALFTDIGNIWMLKDATGYPGGQFSFDRFYKEFAMDVGVGIRFDFNFFILRVDFAIPIRDPAQPEGKRWVMNNWQFSDFIVNFGIGYPF